MSNIKRRILQQRGAEIVRGGRMFLEAIFGDSKEFFRRTGEELDRELEQRRAIETEGHDVTDSPKRR
jgi:hypothetical protein